ncbi:copper resistance CopC family protein [Cryobacterium sp.]|jgi:methionine-rich copper-binding protein CopC|uniref:copper resistance CopC family protein n=1 Tax=Cryobacterium sp. TaxID=1926290 RepID=UPI002639A210|nr:copper resistance CopC family protein [Cryobacterium sp.]MCU1446467.1 Transport integral rane protein [Cryobacterium sp.]
MAQRLRSVSAGVAAIAAVLLLTFGGAAAPATAHDALISSSPAEGSTVAEVETVALTFSDTLLNLGGIDNAFVIQVIGPDDRYYETSCTTLAGAVISSDAALGVGGEYTVQWQVVSADGHPISDTYTFDYQPVDATSESEGSSTPASCGTDVTDPKGAVETGNSDSSGLLLGLALGGGFVLVVGIAVALLIRETRRRE